MISPSVISPSTPTHSVMSHERTITLRTAHKVSFALIYTTEQGELFKDELKYMTLLYWILIILQLPLLDVGSKIECGCGASKTIMKETIVNESKKNHNTTKHKVDVSKKRKSGCDMNQDSVGKKRSQAVEIARKDTSKPPNSFKVIVYPKCWRSGIAVDWNALVRDKGEDETLGVWTEGCVEPEWLDSIIGSDVIVPGHWVNSTSETQRGFITNYRGNLFTIYFTLLDTYCTISYHDLKKVLEYSKFNITPQLLPSYIPTVLRLG